MAIISHPSGWLHRHHRHHRHHRFDQLTSSFLVSKSKAFFIQAPAAIVMR